MIEQKELKVPLSCRIAPSLKQKLENEATEKGISTSQYLVMLLKKRHQLNEGESNFTPSKKDCRATKIY